MSQRKSTKQWVKEVVLLYESSLIRYAAVFLGDIELSKEVVQETFIALIEARPNKVQGLMPQWLYKVCRNKCINVSRRKKLAKKILKEVAQSIPREFDSPESDLNNKQCSAFFAKAIDSLNESQKEVMTLKYAEGFSYQQISEVTGHSISNVGFILYSAIKKVKEQMEEQAGDTEVQGLNGGKDE